MLTLSLGIAEAKTAFVEEPPPPFDKQFSPNPVPSGSTVQLAFSILNLDRDNPATGITFSDDLDATLSGLQAVGLLPSDVCGPGSTLTGTSVLTLTGGNLGAGERCDIAVMVQVPAGAASGIYTNTTSALTSDAGHMADAAEDALTVAPLPGLSMEFTE